MEAKRKITITIDTDLFVRFKEACTKNDLKVSTKINSLIKEWLNQNKK
ncbi:MAG: plasmid partition protein ParG [Candidatus Micrarchaeia archaeon]